MGAQTPEGKVKNMVRKLIKDFQTEYDALDLMGKAHPGGWLYAHWPVMNGMGMPSLDCIICYYGQYIAVETKARGKKPTPRQELTINQMKAAGAVVFIVSDKESCEALRHALELIKWSHAGTRQPQA